MGNEKFQVILSPKQQGYEQTSVIDETDPTKMIDGSMRSYVSFVVISHTSVLHDNERFQAEITDRPLFLPLPSHRRRRLW